MCGATALDVEALSAAAFVLDVGVAELEPLVKAFAGVVELGTLEVGQALWVDQQLDAVALELQIVGVRGVGEFQLVRHAGAARGAHAPAQAHPLPAPGTEDLDVACSFFAT